MDQQIQYKIQEPNIDPKLVKIKKTYQEVAEFSLQDIANNEAFINKRRTEIQAQIKIENSKLDNIKEHHPKILELSDMELHTAFLAGEAKNNLKKYEPVLQRLTEQLVELAFERANIKKELNLE